MADVLTSRYVEGPDGPFNEMDFPIVKNPAPASGPSTGWPSVRGKSVIVNELECAEKLSHTQFLKEKAGESDVVGKDTHSPGHWRWRRT